jgi:hypothetical protein
MYKCLKCNKEFQTQSKLEIHKNRKTPCNITKQNLECNVCNVKFTRPAEQLRHEKTKKHTYNIEQLHINGNYNNTHLGDINNILNLTLNVKSFKNTDTSIIRKNLIDSIGYSEYLDIINKDYLSEIDKAKQLFKIVLDLLQKLHFSLDLEENHNLKILLIFPGIKKQVYEYLILDINPETKAIVWNSLKYEEMIKQIIEHLLDLNNNINNDNYDKFIYYLKRYLVTKEDSAMELKPYIEEQLGNLYKNFNNLQKKEPREIKNTFSEKVKEYNDYRNDECKLNNGFVPEIINSTV